MTLQEAKDQIAKKQGFKGWSFLIEAQSKKGICISSSEAAELYCQSQKAQAWDAACEAQKRECQKSAPSSAYEIWIANEPFNPYIETKKD